MTRVNQSQRVIEVPAHSKVAVHNVTRLNAGTSLDYNLARPGGTYYVAATGARYLRIIATSGEFTVTITNQSGASSPIPMEFGGTLADLVLDGLAIYTVSVEETSGVSNASYLLLAY